MRPDEKHDVEHAGKRLGTRGADGFTLVEVLVAVAIVGMLASVAIPLLQRAMLRSRQTAAASDLRVLQDGLIRYAADVGSYPSFDFDMRSLRPVAPTHIKSSRSVLKQLQGGRLEYYLPWDVLTVPFSSSTIAHPQSFLIICTLGSDASVRFIVTDSAIYYWIDGVITPIGSA